MNRRRIAGAIVVSFVVSTRVAFAASVPAWDKTIDSPARFKVLSAFDGAAVLDRETGLVWEKTATLVGSWRASMRFCALRSTGGRMGWRLPALEELLTLVDPSVSTPALPAGAPFENVFSTSFWTANEEEADPTLAVTVSLDVFTLASASKTSTHRVLCVRAGRGSTTGVRGGL
jgi:uncharacterized protein DUF1566